MKWLGPFLSAKNSLASFRFALRSHSLICFTVILLIWFLQSRSSAWSRLFHCGVATSSACCCGDIGVWVSPRSCRHASCTRVSLSPPFTSRSADSTRQRFRRSRCCSALRYGRRGVCSRWLSGIVFSPAALLAPSICLRSKSLSPAPCCSRSELWRAACFSSGSTIWLMPCHCSSENCRGAASASFFRSGCACGLPMSTAYETRAWSW